MINFFLNRLKSIILAVTVLISATGRAQNAPSLKVVSPPAPEVSALGKFGLVPVNYSTGVPDISIPVYTVKDGTLTFPISLKYHAGGIKVKEDASEVGLGWALSAGGSIVSVVRGEPDLPSGFLNTYQVMPDSPSVISTSRQARLEVNNWYYMWQNDNSFFPNYPADGIYYRICSGLNLPHNNVYSEYYNSFTVGYTGQAPDFASDLYIITIGEKSYKFIFDNNLHPVVLGDGALKIEMIPNGLYPDWKVTDEQGIIYYFTQRQFSYTNTTDPANSQVNTPNVLSTWLLTKITSPTYGEIDFKYKTSRQTFVHPLPNLAETYLVGNVSTNTQQYTDVVTTNFTQYDQANIDSIQFTNGQVKFLYDDQRLDLQGARRLAAVEVRDKNNRFIKRLNLWNNDYFVGSQGISGNTVFQSTYNNLTNYSTDNHTKRLRLDSLTEIDSTSTRQINKYIFSYNQQVNLPDKLSLDVDHWGYYNGHGNLQLVPPATITLSSQSTAMTFDGGNRNAEPAFMQANILTGIKYPTGGTKSFTYETNQFTRNESVTTTTDSTIDSYYKSSGSATANESGILSTTGDFTAPTSWNGKKLSIFCLVYRDGNYPTTDNLDIVINKDGSFLKRISTAASGIGLVDSSIVLSGGSTYNISFDSYSPDFFTSCEIRRQIYVLKANVNTTQSLVTHYSGGLRVSSIKDYDPVTNSTVTKTYSYFNGTEDDTPIYVSQEGQDNAVDPPNPFRYRYGTSIYPFSDGRDAPYFCYGKVQVSESDSNQPNGVSEYDYNTSGSIDINTMLYFGNSLTQPLIANPILAPIPVITQGRGELIAEKFYKNASNTLALVAKNDYYYTITNSTKIWQMVFNQGLSSKLGDWENTQYFRIYAHHFAVPVNRNMLDSKDHFEYDLTGNLITSTFEKYAYDNINGHYQIVKKTVGTSKGDTINTYYKYPQDYTDLASQTNLDTLALGVLNLQQKHIVTPVETYNELVPAVSTDPKKYYGGLLNTFKTDLPVLNGVQSIKNNGTLSSFSFSNVSNGTFVKNSSYENRIKFLKYDSQGRLLRQALENGPPVSYQWGYNGQYPVAQVMNAANNDIFFDSFEEGDGNSASGDAKTGRYSFSGAYNKTLSGLDNGAYTLTYWSKVNGSWNLMTNANITVSNSSYTISLPSGQVDDVRFYPSAAQMTTWTYNPLIGITSMTDPKCMTSYYEYDGFQRLMNIKDKDGNIVKHIDYHYQGQ